MVVASHATRGFTKSPDDADTEETIETLDHKTLELIKVNVRAT